MKAYQKQDAGSAAAGGSSGAVDVKTWRKYMWQVIHPIALLEQHVVRCNNYFFLLLSSVKISSNIPHDDSGFADSL